MEALRYGGVSKMYRCPVCRRLFLIPFQSKGGGRTHWVYQRQSGRRKIYYCSYHCYVGKTGGMGQI